jgi:hypothetical protein
MGGTAQPADRAGSRATAAKASTGASRVGAPEAARAGRAGGQDDR